MRVTATSRIAGLVSRLTNPCFFGTGLLLLASYRGAEPSSLIGPAAAIVILLAAMPAAYVRFRISATGSHQKGPEGMTEYLRHHPRDILALSLLFGLPCAAALILLRAPAAAVVAVVALIVTSQALALVNLRYRASYHVAAVTSLALTAVALGGATSTVALAVVPLVGWSRYHLRQHTIAQMSAGCILAAAVSALLFLALGPIQAAVS
jgi:hypothetical protein